MWRDSVLMLVAQPIAEGPQTWKRFAVFRTIGRFLTGDDVVDVTNRKALYFNAAFPRIGESLDTVRSVDNIHVERTILELHKVLIFSVFRREVRVMP